MVWEGEYLEDKKHGYGVYKWLDGRQYAGYWSDGRQHGLGVYKVPSEGRVKFGLWEEGRRLRWFSPEEQKQINNQEIDYRDEFDNKAGNNNDNNGLPDGCTFVEPENQQKRLDDVALNVEVIRKQWAKL